MSVTAKLKLVPATVEDAEAIASLRNAISDDLTFKHGKGPWTAHHTTAGVLFDLRHAKVYVALKRDEVIASLNLATRKPWAIDLEKLSPSKRPLYLTSLTIAPEFQRRGYGRASLDEAVKLARRAKADALVLDAYDHPKAGAGDFYMKCGFREIARATYRDVPLRYFEPML